MIQLENICKKFGKKTVLNNVSISFQEGIYGLIGQNGAGKTTLMRILATVLQADSGNILIDDQTYDTRRMRKEIGYLPQHFSMYRGLSVEESLSHIALLKEINNADISNEVDKVLDDVNLNEKRKSLVGNLSGGMLRRLGIAQALLGEPKLLILDEPTVGLDPEERLNFRGLLLNIGSSRTTFISTHIVEDAEAVCDNVVVLSDGEVLAQGTHSELLSIVKGKVWECRSENKISFDNNVWVVSQKKQDNYFISRVICEDALDNGRQVAENLEDSYIYLIKKAENL
ncbi:MAG: ATP-binding cassette domain-containing protein [Lachnospiraceae bacterium]|nr:ATP-binding cassette domain-containing protein [Lachnospiraceae bacterium]MEE3461657.1 ATP-binding cassette domain-containing protein [Lachnospiraceae bacterium]